jgi:hypothetical protein
MVKKISAFLLFYLSFLNVNAQNLDIDILKKLNPEDPHSGYLRATSASVYFISAGTPLVMLVTGLANNDVLLEHKAYEMIGASIIDLTISGILKVAVNRKRPAESYPLEVFPYRNVSGKSFPSGHTSVAFATAASLSLQFKKWYVVVPAYIWAGSVGYSRMYLGVHYPTDVLTGAAIGIGSAYLARWLHGKIICKTKHVVPVKI